MADLLGRPVEVANVGVELFAGELERQGVGVERVDWRPPADGGDALRRLALDAAAIARANDEAVERLDSAQPLLVGVGVARDLLPGMTDRTGCTKSTCERYATSITNETDVVKMMDTSRIAGGQRECRPGTDRR